MISDKLFSYIISNWKEWIVIAILFVIGGAFEVYEKGLETALLVFSGLIATIIMIIVICDFVTWVFKRYKLGREWFILLFLAVIYALLLILIRKFELLKATLLFSVGFSFVFLILFTLRDSLTKK